jgi:hypothetical protein
MNPAGGRGSRLWRLLELATLAPSTRSDEEAVVGKSVGGKTAEELSADFGDAGTFLLTENRIDTSEPRPAPCVPRENRGASMGGRT